MKFVILAAVFAAVTSSTAVNDDSLWPWQVGKLYRYDVESYNLARLQEGASTGNAFRARLILRVRAPGRLQARLEHPEHADVHQMLEGRPRTLPSDLTYQPVKDLDKPFEILLEGGRVRSLKAPSSLSLAHENLLKGLISTLQVDLSANHRNEHSARNYFDKEAKQGQFRKMETDVTGDCETLYTISPVASEWRRELINFSLKEAPIEITKSKNYDHCHHRVAYNFGVPRGAEWTGTAQDYREEQFISRSTISQILADKQAIYKAKTMSTVNVHPHLYGKQKAEVLSKVKLHLTSFEDDKESEWEKLEDSREIKSLLFAVAKKQMSVHDESASSSIESHEQVSSEEQVALNRERRSPKIVSINKIIIKKRSQRADGSSWEQSNESSSDEEYISLINDPVYTALYMNPQKETDVKQTPANAQKLVQELAQQLQNPNNMPKADFLTKFSILIRLISSMSYEQLTQVSRGIETAKSSTNVVKADMWMIYRDAVAQTGNLPAFKQIVAWIESKKIKGEEAAEIVATLVSTLRYPTKEVMTQFFKLAMNPVVREQQYLNTTTLISATKFINLGQVNNYTAHYLYPTHMYGRFADKHDKFVLLEILPPLVKELESALQKKDISKAQVFIKAIGNLGHRQILDVFAPYLEGKISVSNFLRTLMIKALEVVSNQKDRYVRNVMYSIMRNTAEPYEVRVAAIRNVFIAHPSPAMMQAMAQMTHYDPSVNVRAALKTSIVAAAQLKNPSFMDLAKASQAVLHMVTKEEFTNLDGTRTDFYDREHGFDITSFLNTIPSEDNLIPKHLKYGMKSKASEWNVVKSSFSSVQQFLDYFKLQISTMLKRTPKSEPSHKFSADKVSEMLNIKMNPQEPLAANLDINFMNQERYFTFDEDDLKKLPTMMKELIGNLNQGYEKHYTKVLNQAQVAIMFPTAMGMPFLYRYKEPIVIHMQGRVKGEITLAKKLRDIKTSIEKEIQITFARNLDGSVGFYDTLSEKYALAGVVSKVQVNIPMKMELEMKSGQVKINLAPLRPDQDTTIGHYSVWPYTTSQKKGTIVPVSLDTATKLISRNNKVNSIDFRFGQSTGTQFQFQGYSYSKDYTNFGRMIRSDDWLANILLMLTQRDIALTHYNFRYLGKQSPSKGVIITATYEEVFNQKLASQNPFTATKVQDVTPNSAGRREEIVKRVASGINTAKVQLVDLSATFDGTQKSEFVLTAAIGQSPVDRKIQFAVFAAKNSPSEQNQINLAASVRKSEVTAMNLLEALKKELKTNFEVDIKYGADESGTVEIRGHTERSKKYVEELHKHPLYQRAMKEIADNNIYQEASHKMLVWAHAPDYVKASINYKNVSPAFRYMIFQAYRIAECFGYWYTDVNPLKNLPDGKIELEAQAFYLEDKVNMMLKSRYGEVQMKSVPIPRSAANMMSNYEPFEWHERVANFYSRHQYLPLCTVDDNLIRTFSERIYNYKLSSAWHVVMHHVPRPEVSQWSDELVVLARRPSEKQQEVYISYQSETGKDLEIEIKPMLQGSTKPVVSVKTNSKKVNDGDLTMYWDDQDESKLLEYFVYPDGVLMMNIRENRLRVMYDGERLVVLAWAYRNSTRGICGVMNGERRDDYMTPFGLVDKPELYGATYALNVENIDAKTKELQEEAKKMAYQREYQYTTVLKSDKVWQKAMDESSEEDDRSENVYRSRAYSKQRGTCQMQQQVQYFENHGEICISTSPINACQSHCNGEDYSVISVQVVCRPKLDREFQEFRNQIRLGQNPTVTGTTETKLYRIPASCMA